MEQDLNEIPLFTSAVE